MRTLTRTQREWGIGLTWLVALGLCVLLGRTGHLSGGAMALAFLAALVLPAWWWNRHRD